MTHELRRCTPAQIKEIRSRIPEIAKGFNVSVMVEQDKSADRDIPEEYEIVNLNVSWLVKKE